MKKVLILALALMGILQAHAQIGYPEDMGSYPTCSPSMHVTSIGLFMVRYGQAYDQEIDFKITRTILSDTLLYLEPRAKTVIGKTAIQDYEETIVRLEPFLPADRPHTVQKITNIGVYDGFMVVTLREPETGITRDAIVYRTEQGGKTSFKCITAGQNQ